MSTKSKLGARIGNALGAWEKALANLKEAEAAKANAYDSWLKANSARERANDDLGKAVADWNRILNAHAKAQ
jgi:hypothetical protein